MPEYVSFLCQKGKAAKNVKKITGKKQPFCKRQTLDNIEFSCTEVARKD